jgi:hypothetical protein
MHKFDLASYVKKSTAASGVPLKVADPDTLRKIAQMLRRRLAMSAAEAPKTR